MEENKKRKSDDSLFPVSMQIDGEDIRQLSNLVGNRFIVDQIPIELLSEFLIILNSNKKINGNSYIDEMFPVETVKDSFYEMTYQVKYRLYFKLFTLWSSGKHPKNSISHENEFEKLNKNMEAYFETDLDDKRRCMEILSNLYQGFQVAGASRDWCARSFLPISKSILAGESIWRATKVTESQVDFDIGVKNNFCHDGHSFYARGGEVLYLQLLLAFTKTREEVNKEIKFNPFFKGLRVTEEEMNPSFLQSEIEKGFKKMFCSDSVPSAFNKFIENFEKFSDEESFKNADNKIGFIRRDCWSIGYLFALELSRLFKSSFDVIDRIKMLQNECVLQVVRTLLYMSSLQLKKDSLPKIAIVSANCNDTTLKNISNRSFLNCQKIIKKAFENITIENDLKSVSKKAHTRYGYGIFRKYGKEIGLIIPKKGGNEHFVLTKDILILLISTTLKPAESLTIESFLKDIELRFGFVFDDIGFTKVNTETNIKQNVYDDKITEWLVDMLDECGYFIPLSDALSLVKNNNISED